MHALHCWRSPLQPCDQLGYTCQLHNPLVFLLKCACRLSSGKIWIICSFHAHAHNLFIVIFYILLSLENCETSAVRWRSYAAIGRIKFAVCSFTLFLKILMYDSIKLIDERTWLIGRIAAGSGGTRLRVDTVWLSRSASDVQHRAKFNHRVSSTEFIYVIFPLIKHITGNNWLLTHTVT